MANKKLNRGTPGINSNPQNSQIPERSSLDFFREIEAEKMRKSIEHGDYHQACESIKNDMTGGKSIEDLLRGLRW